MTIIPVAGKSTDMDISLMDADGPSNVSTGKHAII